MPSLPEVIDFVGVGVALLGPSFISMARITGRDEYSFRHPIGESGPCPEPPHSYVASTSETP